MIIMIKYPLLLLFTVHIASYRKNEKVEVLSRNKEIKKNIETYLDTYGKKKISNLIFSYQIFLYLIMNNFNKNKYDSELTEIKINDSESVHIEFIKNESYNKKDNNKLIVYSPGLLESYRDIIIENLLNRFSDSGYNVCIFWKYGMKDKTKKSLTMLGNIEHYNKAMEYILDKDYQNIYLMGLSAGNFNIIKYIISDNLDTRIKGAAIISSILNADKYGKEMPKFWKRYFRNKLTKQWKISYDKNINYDNYYDYIKKTHVKDDDDLRDLSNKLNDIKIPTLFLNSKDDPIVKNDFSSIKTDKIIKVETNLGGHGTFVRFENFRYKFSLFNYELSNEFFKKINQNNK